MLTQRAIGSRRRVPSPSRVRSRIVIRRVRLFPDAPPQPHELGWWMAWLWAEPDMKRKSDVLLFEDISPRTVRLRQA